MNERPARPMAAERWQQVARLFAEASELEGAAREGFLDEHCGDDLPLREEVESLLVADQCAPPLLDRGALELISAELVADESPDGSGDRHIAAAPTAPIALPAGARLGPFEILRPLGAGGMGEVFEARDTRLGRSVAIKVLPRRLASDPSFQARFEREAQAVSRLSHPHICTLHDVGEAVLEIGGSVAEGGAPVRVTYLVMEHLTGETLADRLLRGALPIAEALELGRQIATALEAAHRQSVVHRDLKPGNVMLTASGVKLIDFGLARLSQGGDPANSAGIVEDGTRVFAEGPATSPGTLLGTAHYMAPEQLEGRPADARSDLFALGIVLHEMLTARRPFEGASAASVITAVMGEQPEPVSRSQPMAPRALDALVATCLAKDPEERWQSARDVALQLRWLAEEGLVAPTPRVHGGREGRHSRVAWVLLAAALTALALGLALRQPPPTAVPSSLRFTLQPPPGTTYQNLLALSPDGRQLVFGARAGGETRLWLRPLDTLEAQPLPGTEGGQAPFWSPDGRAFAFFADGDLKRYDLGGAVRTLCPVSSNRGGAWSRHGVILFGDEASGLFRVPADGGVPVPVPVLAAPDEVALVFWPHFLPDGNRFVAAVGHPEKGGIYLGALDSEERRRLVPSSSFQELSRVEYDPSSGHLLFARDGALLAQRFDSRRLVLLGEPVRVADRVFVEGPGAAHFSVSHSGSLAFRAEGSRRSEQLTWYDRTGSPIEILGDPGYWRSPRVAPDGTWVAFQRELPLQPPSIWLYDTRRGTTERLTSGFVAGGPVWSADSRRIAFTYAREGPPNPFVALAPSAGGGPPQRLARLPFQSYVTSWTPDGHHLVLQVRPRGRRSWDLWLLEAETGQAAPLLATDFDETQGQVSPDGNWLAYVSSESGQAEVYLTSFPEPGVRHQVSTRGGRDPRWVREGRELFYLGPNGALMTVPLTTSTGPHLGQPRELFTIASEERTALGPSLNYEVTPDGERFLLRVPTGEPSSPPLTVFVGWAGE